MERLEDQRVAFIVKGDGQPHPFLAHNLTGTEVLNISSTLLKMVHRKSVHRDRECHCQGTDLLLPSTVELLDMDEPTFARLRQFSIYGDYHCVALTPKADEKMVPSLSESLGKGDVYPKTAPVIYEIGRRFRSDVMANCSRDCVFLRSLHFQQMKSPHMAGQYHGLLCHIRLYLAATRFWMPELQALTLGRLRICLYYLPCSERVADEVFSLFGDLDDSDEDSQDAEIVRQELIRYIVAHTAVLFELGTHQEYLTQQPDVARDLYNYMGDQIREAPPGEDPPGEEEELRSTGRR